MNAKTLRDEFAMAALPQIITSMRSATYDVGLASSMNLAAETAYEYADAMIAERTK